MNAGQFVGFLVIEPKAVSQPAPVQKVGTPYPLSSRADRCAHLLKVGVKPNILDLNWSAPPFWS